MPNGDNKQSQTPRSPFEPLIILLVISLVAGQIMEWVNQFFAGGYQDVPAITWVTDFFSGILPALQVVAIFASAFFVASIIYINKKIVSLRREEAKELYPEGGAERESEAILPGVGETPSAFEKNPRWRKVVELAESENGSDWRMAIIEADIMLGEILENMGYRGESIGERLKQIERSDFLTLDRAWEAHKARNRIAHAGSGYRMNQREVRRVIDLYRQVFEEFHYI